MERRLAGRCTDGGNGEPRMPRYGNLTIVALLVAAGAPVEPGWLSEENARANPRMVAALSGQDK